MAILRHKTTFGLNFVDFFVENLLQASVQDKTILTAKQNVCTLQYRKDVLQL